MHGNLVYELAEDELDEDLLPDLEVYEAARRIDEVRWFYRFTKRAFDLVFSVSVHILLRWLCAIIAIAIKIDDPHAPVIFKQERVGIRHEPCRMKLYPKGIKRLCRSGMQSSNFAMPKTQ